MLPMPLLADSFTYTYTGNDFTNLFASGETQLFTKSDFISGEFTLSAPLADNLISLTAITPASFSFSNGVDTFYNTTPNLSPYFYIETNASGDITGWLIEIQQQIAGGGYDFLETQNESGYAGDYGQNADGGIEIEGYNASTPGTFVESSVVSSATPEPSSLVLLGTGMLTLVAVRHRQLFDLRRFTQ
jgi:hypothetical protein